MKKFVKTLVVGVMATLIVSASALPTFAATNSIGSVATDIGIVDDSNYTVTGNDSTQNKSSEYETVSDFVEATDGKTYQTNVYSTIAEGQDIYDPSDPNADEETGMVDGSILVSVPKTLVLGQTAEGVWSGSYTIKVKGNISGSTVISVVPDENFKMSQVGKPDITVTTSQPKTKFVVADSTVTGDDVVKGVTASFNDDAVTTGTMSTTEASAGSWSGICNFNISMYSVD